MEGFDQADRLPSLFFDAAKMTIRESSSSKVISMFRAPHPEIRGWLFSRHQKINSAIYLPGQILPFVNPRFA